MLDANIFPKTNFLLKPNRNKLFTNFLQNKNICKNFLIFIILI